MRIKKVIICILFFIIAGNGAIIKLIEHNIDCHFTGMTTIAGLIIGLIFLTGGLSCIEE